MGVSIPNWNPLYYMRSQDLWPLENRIQSGTVEYRKLKSQHSILCMQNTLHGLALWQNQMQIPRGAVWGQITENGNGKIETGGEVLEIPYEALLCSGRLFSLLEPTVSYSFKIS